MLPPVPQRWHNVVEEIEEGFEVVFYEMKSTENGNRERTNGFNIEIRGIIFINTVFISYYYCYHFNNYHYLCGKQREAAATIRSLVKLQPWFLSLRWELQLRFLRLQ